MKILNFMAWRRVTACISIILVLLAIVTLFVQGLRFSMEFTGGTVLELRYSKPIVLSEVIEDFKSAGYEQVSVAYFGSDSEVIVRLPALVDDQFDQDISRIVQIHPANSGEVLRIEKVGPQVAGELRDQAVYAVLISMFALLLYISYRFQYKFAIGATAALVHDVLIVVGIFAFMQWEFNLSVFAAVLTVIGYSLNDTIVIFDRIRENLRKRGGDDAFTVINRSITQTLERTLITVLTTLIVVLALFFVGGETIHGFATALIIGLVVGTYSSVYIASTIIYHLKISRLDLLDPIAEEKAAELEQQTGVKP